VSEPSPLRVGRRTFEWGRRTYIMAIVNVTPDSFTGLGPGVDRDAAVEFALRAVADGADLLDVGGESTRPGADPVAEPEELARVVPVVEALVGRTDVPIAVDTRRPAVARAALAAGAALVNDQGGLRAAPEMARVAAAFGVPVIAMANLRGVPRAAGHAVGSVQEQLRESLSIAAAAGLSDEAMILDPGFGFGTAVSDNLDLLRNLGRVRALGRPVLVGLSRKATIGRLLGGLRVSERLEGTIAANVLAVAHGADILRVHDVRAVARAARIADAVVRGWQEPAAAEPARADGSAR
jgi:dihydropteroate synthase